MIYVRDTIRCNEILWQNPTDLECIGLNMILSPQMFFTLIVIYRAPALNNSFYDELKKVLCQCDFKKEVIVMGDFNITWEDKSRKKLKQITDGFNLVQMIKGPTRITNSTSTQIDLVFSNRLERIVKSYNMITGLSDHNMVLISRKLTSKRFNTHFSNKEFSGIPKNKQDDFNEAIKNMNWEDLLYHTDLEIASQTFTEKLQSTISDFSIQMKCKNKKQSLPWVNDNIKQLMKERGNALKLATRSKRTHDRSKFVMLRNKVVRVSRKAKADFFF